MKIQMHILQGPSAKRTFVIEKNSQCVVGRDQTVDFQINDELLSREHFSIEFTGANVILRDLGSTNGTFLNNHQLEPNRPYKLEEGQQFIAGRVSTFKFSFVRDLPSQRSESPRAPTSQQPDSRGPVRPTETSSNFGSSIYDVVTPTPADTPSIGQYGSNSIFSVSITRNFDNPTDSGIASPADAPSSVDRSINRQQPSEAEYRGPRSFENVDRDAARGQSQSGGNEESHGGSIAGPGSYVSGPRNFPPLEDPEKVPVAKEVDRPELEHPSFGQRKIAESDEISQDSVYGTESESSANPTPFAREDGFDVEPQQPNNQKIEARGHQGSIAVPGQMPAEPRPVLGELPTQQPDASVYRTARLANGLFVHAGENVEDVALVLKSLQKNFETLFCVHPERAGIEAKLDEPAQTLESHEAETGSNFVEVDEAETGSNFVEGDEAVELDFQDDSPFAEDPLGAGEDEDFSSDSQAGVSQKLGTPLFDWMPDSTKWSNPVLLKNEDFSYEIEPLWQKDAVVCLFGESCESMTEHCRRLIKTNVRTGKIGDSMFGFCWPTVLDSSLQSMATDSVNLIYADCIKVFLLEDPQQQHGWCLFSQIHLGEILSNSGFFELNEAH